MTLEVSVWNARFERGTCVRHALGMRGHSASLRLLKWRIYPSSHHYKPFPLIFSWQQDAYLNRFLFFLLFTKCWFFVLKIPLFSETLTWAPKIKNTRSWPRHVTSLVIFFFLPYLLWKTCSSLMRETRRYGREVICVEQSHHQIHLLSTKYLPLNLLLSPLPLIDSFLQQSTWLTI